MAIKGNKMFWACGVACAALAAFGETYKLSKGDAVNTSSFNAIGNWVLQSNPSTAATEAPCAGNDYVASGVMLRTPSEAEGTQTFGGDSLTLSGATGYLAFKGKSGSTIVVTNMICNGGYVQNATDNTYFNLDGAITVNSGKDLRFMMVEPNWRGAVVKAPISGAGTEIWLQLVMRDLSTSGTKYVCLEGDNSGFTGKFRATGGGYFIVNSDAAFGAVPSTTTADAITINGPLWRITNHLETASTRGITLPNTQTNNTSNATLNSYPGMRLQVASTATAWIRGPISGDGPIVKTGDSGVVHFTGSFANYTGEVKLERGVTWFDGPDPVSLSSITMSVGLGLSSNELTVATLNCTSGNFWVHLDDADPDVPRLTVTDSFTHARTAALFIVQSSYPANKFGTTFKLIKAPGNVLSKALAEGWLYAQSADTADLAVQDNGDGTETLLYTRVASDKLYYHSVNDPYGTSGFSIAAWKHNRSDDEEEAVVAAAGNSYIVNWGGFRTPENKNDVFTFPGSKLVLKGVGITLKSPNATTRSYMTNTWCYNKSDWWVSTPQNVCVDGDLHLLPMGDYAMSINSASQKRTCDLYSELKGTGALWLYGGGNPAYGSKMYTIALHASNTNYNGAIYVYGQTNFYCRIASEESLGANPLSFSKDMLKFNGAGLMVTNNVTLDDSNRGIWLNSTGGTCGIMNDDSSSGASYATGTPEADRKYPGGAWFNAYGAGTLLKVDCVIGGPGALSVYADGVVSLGGANVYTGGTVVRRGTLTPTSDGALGTGAVTVMSGGTLCVPDDAEALPYGAVLNDAITFEDGSAITHAGIASRAAESASFTVPLLLLAPGETMTSEELAALPVATGLPKSWLATPMQQTVTVDGVERTAVYAQIKFGATTIFVR